MPQPNPPRTISVIIPCLNDAVLLHRCLDSLARQEVLPKEIIVVDNGSTDDSVDVALAGGARVSTELRRGITWATRTGFDTATGDIFLRIDADVSLPPDFLARVHAIWDAAEVSPGRRVVGVTGTARFELPGRLGDLVTGLYLGAYRWSVGSALGHHPLYGTNCSVRADWWREIRERIDSADTYAHDDMQLSFAVRPDETIWFQRDLTLSTDPRPLYGIRQILVRFHRGMHTMLGNWREHPPHRRLAQRGLLGPRMEEKLKK